jgi:predicted enzyme related to lactoylglutathione lyase
MSDTHGRFIWYELTTPDAQASKAFYGAVVGWTPNDMVSPAFTYTRLETHGVAVGGIMPLNPEMLAAGATVAWTGYVAVDDADAACEKIRKLGGAVHRPPGDIPGVGRFAIVGDPGGAVFAIMTPAPAEAPPPAPPRGTSGTYGWRELAGGDPAEAIAFYGELFGWRKDDVVDMGPMGDYLLFSNQDGQVGGMMKKPDHVPAPGWLYYAHVDAIDAGAERVRQAGGQVQSGPHDVPGGDWVLQGLDPQGARFALIGPKAG